MLGILVGIIVGLLLICNNLFKQKLKLQQQVNYLKPMVETVENVRDILYYCETKPKLNYLYLSPTVNYLLGPNAYEEHLQNPEKVFEIVHPDDREVLEKKLSGQFDFSKPIIVRFKHHHGQYIWFEEYGTPIYKDGQFIAILGIIRNIDDKITLQQQLEYKSSHDALTDLYNREYFQSKLTDFNENCDTPIAIIMVDLDELKFINDHYGHQMGDCLIQEAANVFKIFADEQTIVARLGGDEFAVLLANVSNSQVEQYIKNIQVEMNLASEDKQFSLIKASIGYAYSTSSKGVMEQLLSEADAKMYENKKAKKSSMHSGTKNIKVT